MSGTNGQFRTPRHIIAMVVALVNPQPGHRICDPACGTVGFLIAAFVHILLQHTKPADQRRGLVDASLLKPAQWRFLEEQAFTGFDNDANMVKIGILNLYLHRLERARINHFNPLTTGFGGTYPGALFDIIFGNPPFAGKVQDESILADLNYKLNPRATELLFLKWIIDHLAPGGRAGVIVPNGVLFGSTNAATGLRELLLTECDLQAVISLPSGVFKPYAGVATAAVIFQKPSTLGSGTSTRSVWFYDLTADGISLDDKRTPIEATDIPDALAKWPAREEGPNSYRVPIEKIRENDWSLAAGRYKPVVAETVHHDAPVDILNDVLKLENEIIPRLARDIANAMPEVKGFSERNIGYMIRFAREYGPRPMVQQAAAKLDPAQLVPQPAALSDRTSREVGAQPPQTQPAEADPLSILQQLVAKLPWGHNVTLLDKAKDASVRLWYARQSIEHGWSRNILVAVRPSANASGVISAIKPH